MNFELDTYMDAQKSYPSKEVQLETVDGTYHHFKTDIFKGFITYSTDPAIAANLVTITTARAKEVIAMNKKGQKPVLLDDSKKPETKKASEYENVVGQDSLTRFDSQKSTSNKNHRRSKNRNGNKPKNNEKN